MFHWLGQVERMIDKRLTKLTNHQNMSGVRYQGEQD